MTEPSGRAPGTCDALLRSLRRRASCVALLLFSMLLPAQQPRVRSTEAGTVALRQALRDLGTDTQALLVTAHPDDLYLLLGAYLRFAYGWRVEVILLTRGEGGQNLTGPETGDELRRIRTIESEAAAARLGLRLWYANLPDRGFCRSAEEAFNDWGRKETILRMAQAIRAVRPDVVMTTHHAQELHGHDLALLEALPRAVELAATEGAEGLTGIPCRVERVFRAAAPGRKPTRPDEPELPVEQAEFYLPVDAIESVRGDTYRRLAYRVLEEEHRTQRPIEIIETLFPEKLGFVGVPVFGRGRERTDTLEETLTGKLPAFFSAIQDRALRAEVRRSLEEELQDASGEISRFLEQAIAVRRRIRELRLDTAAEPEAGRRRAVRLEALDRAIVSAAGLRVVAESPRDVIAVYGEALHAAVRIHAGSTKPILVTDLSASSGTKLVTSTPLPLQVDLRESVVVPFELTPLQNGNAGTPGNGAATRSDPLRANRYEPPLSLIVGVALDGERFEFPVEVPTEVRPALEITATPRTLLLPSGARQARFAIRVRKNGALPYRGTFKTLVPTSWRIARPQGDIVLDQEVLKDFTFELTLPELFDEGAATITVQLGDARATIRAQRVDLEIDRKLHVGLVRGADDAAESVLRGLGVNLRTLGDDDLVLGALEGFDTIVVDIRALKLRESARAAFDRLLRFAEGGGRLVVLYHKDVEFNVDVAHFRGSPYPLRIGKGRITNEHAPVEVLLPEHPLLNVPNRIRGPDWDGWIQERGLYFAEAYDGHFESLLAMRDHDQLPLERGALLYAQYGKGDYVYTGLALFRQWKALHPGACRLLANLVTPRR